MKKAVSGPSPKQNRQAGLQTFTSTPLSDPDPWAAIQTVFLGFPGSGATVERLKQLEVTCSKSHKLRAGYCCTFEPYFAKKAPYQRLGPGYARPEAYVVLEAPVEESNMKLLIQT